MSVDSAKASGMNITAEQLMLAGRRCERHCSICEGQDHHWMPDCDEDSGGPVMVCKHCDARREVTDEDSDV